MVDRFNILSLSGGGFLGLYTISLLTDLEQAAGGPIARHFDLMAGTSVGAIIALGLAAEVPAERIKTAFEQNGTAIFSDRPAPTTWLGTVWDIARFVAKPKYQADNLRQTIIELIGEDTRIGDLKHPVIVPTVNLTEGKPQIFRTPHHPDFQLDAHLKVVEVALAAAAAPTYFPIAEVNNALYIDGGLYANSPDLLAFYEAEHFLTQPSDTVHILSVGTTTSQFSFAHALRRQLGSFGWLREQRLVKAVIASQQCSVDAIMRHWLGDRYIRLDASQSNAQQKHLAIDVATEAARIIIYGLARATMQSYIGDPRIKALLAHKAAAPVFHH